MIKIDKLKPNPNNPRQITKENLKKLAKSIKEFPEMMELRPIVRDENWSILGGRQRWEAIKVSLTMMSVNLFLIIKYRWK